MLLAGGLGRRLGGDTPKARVMCAGRSLLDRALATLAALCDAVVVVAPGDMELGELATPGAGRDVQRDVKRIADPPGAAGPLAGLVAGLGADAFDDALVLAVDMPLLTPETLTALRALRGEASAVLPAPGGITQPLAAWYTARAFAPLAAALAAGERSPSRVVFAMHPAIIGDDALASLPGGLGVWLNVNTRAELDEAERRLAAREHA